VNINLTLIVQMIVFIVLVWFTMKVVWPMILGPWKSARRRSQRDSPRREGTAGAGPGSDRADAVVREARERATQIIDQAQHRANDLVEQAKRHGDGGRPATRRVGQTADRAGSLACA